MTARDRAIAPLASRPALLKQFHDQCLLFDSLHQLRTGGIANDTRELRMVARDQAPSVHHCVVDQPASVLTDQTKVDEGELLNFNSSLNGTLTV